MSLEEQRERCVFHSEEYDRGKLNADIYAMLSHLESIECSLQYFIDIDSKEYSEFDTKILEIYKFLKKIEDDNFLKAVKLSNNGENNDQSL